MDAFSIAQLLANQDPANPVKLRYGTVSAINDNGTLTVIPDGQTQSVTAVKCCRPKAGSRVVVLVNGTEWLAVSVIGGDQAVVPISQGGTGADTAAGARESLAVDYSTTEAATGELWIDGKKVYRRVFTGTITAAANATPVTSILAAGTAETLVSARGSWAYMADGYSTIPTILDAATIFASVYNTGSGILLQTRSSQARTSAPYRLVVEYTKAAG